MEAERAQVATGGLGSNSVWAGKQVIPERPIRVTPKSEGLQPPDQHEGARRTSHGELGWHSQRQDCTEQSSQSRQAIAWRATVAKVRDIIWATELPGARRSTRAQSRADQLKRGRSVTIDTSLAASRPQPFSAVIIMLVDESESAQEAFSAYLSKRCSYSCPKRPLQHKDPARTQGTDHDGAHQLTTRGRVAGGAYGSSRRRLAPGHDWHLVEAAELSA
jgi:hypothetical protein